MDSLESADYFKAVSQSSRLLFVYHEAFVFVEKMYVYIREAAKKGKTSVRIKLKWDTVEDEKQDRFMMSNAVDLLRLKGFDAYFWISTKTLEIEWDDIFYK
jgi:hypothetical protein